jgi:phosphoglycerate dehydrogenase-like enzyme
MPDGGAKKKAARGRLVVYLPHPLPIWRLPQRSLEKIRRTAGRKFDVDLPMSEAGLAKVVPDAEVLFAWGLTGRLVPAAKKLQWLHTPLSGVDRLLNPEMQKASIRVTSSRGVNSIAVAEHTFGMVLALTRGIAEGVRAQGDRRWAQNELYGRVPGLSELHGKLLGLFGMGEIGRELAVRAQAFGMRVWGLARTARTPPPGVEKVLPAKRAEALVREADVLVLALPLTPQTQGIVGERLLHRMKPTSILVNIGRGALVQEPALVRALRDGWIGGAALDVFAHEPLSPESPLWTMPNVVMTPHVAGTHPDYMARSADIFLENLKRYHRGLPLHNEVDLHAGY